MAFNPSPQTVVSPDAPAPRVVKAKAIRRQRTKASGFALVRAVLSGDTLVLMGSAAPDQQPPEKEVVLSGIRAPLLARGRNPKLEEEPWAWHSREFLRKKCIGRVVHFSVVFRPAEGREYVNLHLGNEDLAQYMVSNGWARVQQKEDEKLQGDRAKLAELQAQAEEEGLGIHNTSINSLLTIRAVEWTPDAELFLQHRGHPIPGIVDRVIDGSSLRVELLGVGADELHHTMITLLLSGAEAPPTPMPEGAAGNEKKGKKEKKEKPAPFALEAQNFVASRLLHRDVHVILQAFDKTNFYGTIQYPKGDITIRLLEEGYAKFIKWSANLTNDPSKLKKAEESAKAQKLRLWQNFAERKQQSEPHEYTGVVTQVINGDRIAVLLDGLNEERKFNLASIRAPRMGVRGAPDEPCAFQAREYLRKKLIGKNVKLEVEYTKRPLPEQGATERQVSVSVYVGKENVSEGLVAAGLATVVRHRKNEDRAQNFDKLIVAELQAERKREGVHGSPQSTTTHDLTIRGRRDDDDKKEGPRENVKGLARLSFEKMQYEKGHIGIVEYVFSGSRFKIRVPKHEVLIPFILHGIQTPPAKDGSTANPYYEEALNFARSRSLQRTVKIDIDFQDKYDNFLGNLFIEKENLAISLVRAGLARLIPGAASRNKYQKDLRAAEDTAKEQKLGLWKDWVEKPVPAEEPQESEAPPEEFVEEKALPTSGPIRPKEGNDYKIRLTEITDAANFYCHFTQDETIGAIEDRMKNFGDEESEEFTEEEPPAGNTVCAGLYNDGNWYRVRMEGMTAGGQWRAFFLDYGNRELLDLSALRVLDDEFAAIPARAHLATLSGIKGPGEKSEYYDRAGMAFSALAWNKELSAHVDHMEGSKLHVTLQDPSDPSSTINQKLMLSGWARIRNRGPRALNKLVASMSTYEEQAKRDHKGIWEYGDVSDEEETERDERGRVPLKKPGALDAKKKGDKKDKAEEKGKEKGKGDEEKG